MQSTESFTGVHPIRNPLESIPNDQFPQENSLHRQVFPLKGGLFALLIVLL